MPYFSYLVTSPEIAALPRQGNRSRAVKIFFKILKRIPDDRFSHLFNKIRIKINIMNRM